LSCNNIIIIAIQAQPLWRRIAVEHLLNPARINFDLDATPFRLEQRG
jgi:hypothetical protein